MKSLVPALLLSAAIPALCQTAPQQLTDPNQLFRFPQQFQFNAPDLTKTPTFAFDKNLRVLPLPHVVLPSHAPELGNAQLDGKIIRRPPMSAFTQQKPRAPLASDLFPGLKILPTETARLEPIPGYFPNAKAEPIPLASPDAKMILIQSAPDQMPQK